MLGRLRSQLFKIVALAQSGSVATRRARYEELRRQKREAEPRALSGYGYKVFSQSDEDGILAEIFQRIGTTNRTFVEFGVGDGLENNTLALLYLGWTGLWIDGSKEHCAKITAGLHTAIASRQLTLINSYVTPDNIDRLIAGAAQSGEIDLLSVDIDGNDVHVLKGITNIRPRVIVVEYNAKFGPSIPYCMGYDPNHIWRKSDRFGASLKFYETVMRERGYSCVGCNLVGTNAFFVRDDLIGGVFEGPFTAERHFEPARYELAGLPSGHPCNYETFSTRVPTT